MTFPQLQVAVTFSYCGWVSAFMIFPRGRLPVGGANNSRAHHEINRRMSQSTHTNQSFNVEVAIPAPLHQTFSYRSKQAVEIGHRVRVNFSGREVIGVVLDSQASKDSTSPSFQIKPILDVLPAETSLNPRIVELCRWASQYYLHPIGEVLAAALPTVLRKSQSKSISRLVLRLADQTLPFADLLSRAPKQLKVCEAMLQLGSIEAREASFHGLSREALRSLIKKGLIIETEEESSYSLPLIVREPLPLLTNEQKSALAHVDIMQAGTTLVQGVTGSGKTELYLRWMAECLSKDQQVLVLVPEIALTPQTIARFKARFEASIVVFHSGLTDQQRLQAWLDCSSGRAHIAIGTRSALFVPMRRPGLIVIDEEHDSSFKQQDGFRYSARDLAVVRAQIEDIPLILGSATPSLESYHNALTGKYQHIRLNHRAGGASQEKYEVWTLPTPHLDRATQSRMTALIESSLGAGGQVLVMINRRGFAPVLFCTECHWIAECEHCDSRMTLHRLDQKLVCHHCSASIMPPVQCPGCGNSTLSPVGEGTQRIEEALRAEFPDHPIHRLDGDSTRSQGAFQSMSDEIHTGKPCILVGTQLVSKGHHFPNLALALLLETDQGLLSSDYRAVERTAQLIFQTGGRVGRDLAEGDVKLLTSQPLHPVMSFIVKRDYDGFARWQLAARENAALPPFRKFAIIRAESMTRGAAKQLLLRLADDLNQGLKQARNQVVTSSDKATSDRSKREAWHDCEVLGPIPPLMERRNRWYRSQILVSAARIRERQQVLLKAQHWLRANAERSLRWNIDIDPSDQV